MKKIIIEVKLSEEQYKQLEELANKQDYDAATKLDSLVSDYIGVMLDADTSCVSTRVEDVKE